ncbi:hypothetical protein BGZ72_007433 [Mortierella alpina]|nr:hypothetical protein BGZ72_007433 [Mortierella alpina]
MQDPRWSVCEISMSRSSSTRLAFDCTTINTHNSGIQILQANLKHILNILSPTRQGEQQNDFPTTTFAPKIVGALNNSGTGSGSTVRTERKPSGQNQISHARPTAATHALPAAHSEQFQKCLKAAKTILGLLITEDDAYAISIPLVKLMTN